MNGLKRYMRAVRKIAGIKEEDILNKLVGAHLKKQKI